MYCCYYCVPYDYRFVHVFVRQGGRATRTTAFTRGAALFDFAVVGAAPLVDEWLIIDVRTNTCVRVQFSCRRRNGKRKIINPHCAV